MSDSSRESKPKERFVEVLADGSLRNMTAKESRELRKRNKTVIRDKTGEYKKPRRERP